MEIRFDKGGGCRRGISKQSNSSCRRGLKHGEHLRRVGLQGTSRRSRRDEVRWRFSAALDSPSARQEVDFNKRVGVAVVVPRGEVSGLQDVDDQVAELLVVVNLKLAGGRAGELAIR